MEGIFILTIIVSTHLPSVYLSLLSLFLTASPATDIVGGGGGGGCGGGGVASVAEGDDEDGGTGGGGMMGFERVESLFLPKIPPPPCDDGDCCS